MMSICVFQGTFNPIHKAHIDMALYALKKYNFDKIIFIPAYIPPHKNISDSLSKYRYEMVNLAIKNIPQFEISDIEYKRKGPSYTYLTILELIKKYDMKERINFLIGTDAFSKITTWYEADKLKELVHFIVFQRCDILDKSEFDYLKNLGYDFEFADKEYLDISSTSIRNNIKEVELLSQKSLPEVMEYIKQKGLYE